MKNGTQPSFSRRDEPFSSDESKPLSILSKEQLTLKKQRQLEDLIKFNFCFLLLIGAVIILSYKPIYYPYFNAVSFIILFSHRIYEFNKIKYQYYLYDFCYLVNIIVVVYSLFLTKAFPVLITAYLFSFVPISSAIVVFKLGFIFHNTVKFTSCWIHLSPTVAMFVVRFLDTEGMYYGSDKLDIIVMDFSFFIECAFYCSVLYFSWVLIYYCILFIWRKSHIDKHQLYTLYNYMLEQSGKINTDRLLIFGEKYTKLAYISVHVRWIYMTLTGSFILFFYQNLAFGYLAFLGIASIFYAGTYYVFVFGENYSKQFNDINFLNKQPV